tara:strand:- start:1112 stop:1381 length:270 start_codon:yes stop_codon:yes gene_type:complete
MVITKLDQIISIIEGTEPKAYTSDPQCGLDLLQKHNVRYLKSDAGYLWAAYYIDSPDDLYYGYNGLLAGCACIAQRQLSKITHSLCIGD